MPIPGSNIRTLRQQLGLSIIDLARETGIDKGNLSKLEVGKVGYSRDVMDRIARVLHVSLGVLFADPGVVEAAALHMRQAPLLTTEQLSQWTGPDDFEYEDDQLFLYLPIDRASRHSFALLAEDERNAPVIMVGDEMIFDSKKQPVTGSYVVAQDSTNGLHIGRLLTLPSQRGEAPFEIIPVREFAHCVSSLQIAGLRLRGVLAEIRRML